MFYGVFGSGVCGGAGNVWEDSGGVMFVILVRVVVEVL